MKETETEESKNARGALEVFKSVLSTPVKERYRQRIDEHYDLVGLSPAFDAYKKLYDKCRGGDATNEENHGLGLLADAAASIDQESPMPSGDTGSQKPQVSKHMADALVFPTAPVKPKPQRMISSLPHNLTSKECIREMALKKLGKVTIFAEKEKKAKRDTKRNPQQRRRREKEDIRRQQRKMKQATEIAGMTMLYVSDARGHMQKTRKLAYTGRGFSAMHVVNGSTATAQLYNFQPQMMKNSYAIYASNSSPQPAK